MNEHIRSDFLPLPCRSFFCLHVEKQVTLPWTMKLKSFCCWLQEFALNKKTIYPFRKLSPSLYVYFNPVYIRRKERSKILDKELRLNSASKWKNLSPAYFCGNYKILLSILIELDLEY